MPIKRMRSFFRIEASSGIVLFVAAILALLIDNSPWRIYYHDLFAFPISVHLGVVELAKPLLLWVNDGLMAIFFLLVGLEIKRETLVGELNEGKKVVLPVIAAIGGMLIPAVIYILFNYHHQPALVGWAIPTATDIAFSLGILGLLGTRLPSSLRVFLTALAIFDDLGAIIIIAVFYTSKISLVLLLAAALIILLLILLNRLNVKKITPYVLLGFILWVCVLKSGVHATLAGVVVALAIPLRGKKENSPSPLGRLEHKLHPWVAYGILPVFAFANAGVSFAGLSLHYFMQPICLGVAAGLFVGKQLGIFGACAIAIKLGLARRPRGMTMLNLYGVSLLAGVGFTMSLFIGSLAFPNAEAIAPLVRVGVLLGSFLSGLSGYLILLLSARKKESLQHAS